jgi:hypothetical protein
MRTTLAIDDHLLSAAKRRARQRGYTLGHLVEEALRRELAEPVNRKGPRPPVFHGGSGPQPGVDLRSNRALTDLLDPTDGEKTA